MGKISFALVTEGPSENRVMRHILNKYFLEHEVFIRDIQPTIINGKQHSKGGWNEVLKFCTRNEDIKEVFNNSEYLIIQVDTDQSQTKPFDVSHTKADNSIKTNEELYQEVKENLRNRISQDLLEEYGNKIFFAVSVHTTECWLLPFYYTNSHKSDIRNCLSTLNIELGRKNMDKIPIRDKNSIIAIRAYEKVLKNWKKKDDIIDSAKHNTAFKLFIESLEEIPVPEPSPKEDGTL